MSKKVAIPINEHGELEGHFGHTRSFALYSIVDNAITNKEILTPPPHAPGVSPKWLNKNGVTDILASTMGERAKKILDHFEISVHLGTPLLNADDVIKSYLADELVFNEELCKHHHHHHGKDNS
ncbi:MAG: ATPase [Draconibacterium sp.]|nr:MAG: ATPase [Draconibacterium sp.]PIF05545.1 MAG: ATPase [Draconibacterium sp.]